MAAPAVAAVNVRLTPHEELEVEVGTSQKEIRRVYRDLARLYHPDKQPVNATEEEHAAAKKKFIAVHAAWESLQKNGFQERENNWEEEEEKDDLEAMQERMTNLRECDDFADEQLNILHSAVGYFEESVPRKPVVPPKELKQQQKRLSIIGGSKKSVVADLKRGLAPKKTVVEPPVDSIDDSDELEFLRRLVAVSFANSTAIKEEIKELEGEITLQVIENNRHVAREEGKRSRAEKKAAAAEAGAKRVAAAERQSELAGVTPVFNWGLVEEAKDFASDVHSWFSGSWFAAPQGSLPKPEAEEEEDNEGKVVAICDGIVA